MSEIDVKFLQTGGPAFFGLPIGGERLAADGSGRVHHWTGGSIWWSPATGAHEVHGLILDRYLGVGAEALLGYPVSDEEVSADGAGRVSRFERGSVL